MKDYTKFIDYAVFTMIDRKTQDDRKSKVHVEALFKNDAQCDNYNYPNREIKRYRLPVDELERFEQFYNFVQDINTKYGDYAIFHINDGDFKVDELNKFRWMLNIWTDAKIK